MRWNITKAENGFTVEVYVPSKKETATSVYGESKTFVFLTQEAVVMFIKETIGVQ